MSIDYKVIANTVAEWCTNDNFFELRTSKQLCTIFDNAVLTSQQFNEISTRIQKYYDLSDICKILQHVHINFENNKSDAFSVLDSISQTFKFQFISDLKSVIQPTTNKPASKSEKRIEKIKKMEGKIDFHKNFYKLYHILCEACKFDDEETIKFAISGGYLQNRAPGFDVESDFSMNIPLLAAKHDNLGMLKTLQKYGADIRGSSNALDTILHQFCKNGNLEGVKFALEFIDVNILDRYYFTPLHFAAEKLNYHVCEYLCSFPSIKKDIKAGIFKKAYTPYDCAKGRIENCSKLRDLLIN